VPSVRKLTSLAACLLLLAACTGDRTTLNQSADNLSALPALNQAGIDALRLASCPNSENFLTPQSIQITATPITIDSFEGATLNGLTFAGSWHLESEEPNFGGLSGLTVHPKDHLLAVSDSGAFVWISMADQAPSGFGAIAYIRDETGKLLSGKTAADSEGLELIDGLALVSFERDHRVLAFDLANCGARANGVLHARLPEKPEGLARKIPANEGAEALMLNTQGHLIAGLEIKARKGAPIGKIAPDASQFGQYLARPKGKRLVGLDAEGGMRFALFRAYSPLSGNQIDIHAYTGDQTEPDILAELKHPFPIDNFEGITATRLPDGTVRLYIISDDNFSDRQRTLLMAFDVSPQSS